MSVYGLLIPTTHTTLYYTYIPVYGYNVVVVRACMRFKNFLMFFIIKLTVCVCVRVALAHCVVGFGGGALLIQYHMYYIHVVI